MRMPWDRFLNMVMGWCLKRIDPSKREEWEYQMNLPLPHEIERKPSVADDEADGAAFLALMSSG